MRHLRVNERLNEKLQNLSGIYNVLAPEHREKAIAGWHILFPDTDYPTADVSKPRSTEDSENLDGTRRGESKWNTMRKRTDAVCALEDRLAMTDVVHEQLHKSRSRQLRAGNVNATTYTTCDLRNWQEPPKNTSNMSDENLYIVIKRFDGKTRGEKWPDIFNQQGHIRADRVSVDPAPLGWLHGLPNVVVYCGYYMLTGAKLAEELGRCTRLLACRVVLLRPYVSPSGGPRRGMRLRVLLSNSSSRLWPTVCYRT